MRAGHPAAQILARRLTLAGLVLAGLSWCGSTGAAARPGAAKPAVATSGTKASASKPKVAATLGAIRTLAFPGATGAGEPALAVDPAGRLYASWLEPRGRKAHALRVARLDGNGWLAPTTVASGDSFFVNWADTPILAASGGGRLAVSWPWKSGAGTYSYDVRVAQSFDDGGTWSTPVVPHRDGTPTEHGFVSMLPEGDRVRLVWLDGRKMASAGGHGGGEDGGTHGADMTLRTATLGANGQLANEAVLDERVCDCCQTAAARSGSRTVVAYRDRGTDERRDIALVRLEQGNASTPEDVHVDGWKINACPVNGPALDASGAHVAIAWYTGAGDAPVIRFARSKDGGRTFGAPQRVDVPGAGNGALGRVDVAVRADGAALVTWLQSEKAGARILTREFPPAGPPAAPRTVVFTTGMRASGFPRVALAGDRVVFVWTDAGHPRRIRAASARWQTPNAAAHR